MTTVPTMTTMTTMIIGFTVDAVARHTKGDLFFFELLDF